MRVSPFLLLASLFTLFARAQGTVHFANTPAPSRLVYTNSQSFPPPGQLPNQVGPMTGDGQYTIGLYIAPVGTTDPSAFTLMGPTTFSHSGVGIGWFNGDPGTGFFPIANNTGQTIAFQVRAWATSAGATFEEAQGNCCGVYMGSSEIGFVTPAMGITLPPQLFGTNPGQIGGFTLVPNGFAPNPVPEPSIAWLLLIGVAAGLGAFPHSFRRRR